MSRIHHVQSVRQTLNPRAAIIGRAVALRLRLACVVEAGTQISERVGDGIEAGPRPRSRPCGVGVILRRSDLFYGRLDGHHFVVGRYDVHALSAMDARAATAIGYSRAPNTANARVGDRVTTDRRSCRRWLSFLILYFTTAHVDIVETISIDWSLTDLYVVFSL